MLMVSTTPGTMIVPLVVSTPWTVPGLPCGNPCLACGDHLLIHQPDPESPERLLGTCDTCGSWHIMDCDRSVTVLLPDADALRDASAASER